MQTGIRIPIARDRKTLDKSVFFSGHGEVRGDCTEKSDPRRIS
jgi:hypothetical protein